MYSTMYNYPQLGVQPGYPHLDLYGLGFASLFFSMPAKPLAGWWHWHSARSLLSFPGRGFTGFQSLPPLRLLKAFVYLVKSAP